MISYSLGDAIDWKRGSVGFKPFAIVVSYSLGDAIDWKLSIGGDVESVLQVSGISYSLGDAIDWKLCTA